MNVGELLEPLVVKAIASKGYSREQAVDKAWKWLAKELGVSTEKLKALDDSQQWCAHALVEKALLLPPSKQKRKIDIPSEWRPPISSGEPMGDAFWAGLRKQWGDKFFDAFFGDFTPTKVEGTLAPGQYAIDEIMKANKTALIDAA